jgi:hypothetical protein
MANFYLDFSDCRQLRLSCSYLSCAQIDDRVARLARLLDDARGRSGRARKLIRRPYGPAALSASTPEIAAPNAAISGISIMLMCVPSTGTTCKSIPEIALQPIEGSACCSPSALNSTTGTGDGGGA